MPAFNTLHHELRLRVPNKPYEFYDDAVRWAIAHICRKTSLWGVTTAIVTEPGKDVYDLDLPSDSVTHSNLYIIQKGSTDRVISRPVNGFKVSNNTSSDYTKSYRSVYKNKIQIVPIPKDGGITLEIRTAVKPTTAATSSDNNKFFEDYKDTVIYGALFRCLEDSDLKTALYNEKKFKNGVSSIHIDVLKENANTPMKISAGW